MRSCGAQRLRHAGRVADGAAIQRACERTNVIIQPLRIDEATLHKRQSEPGPADIARFFLDVAMRAERLAQQFRLTVRRHCPTEPTCDVDSAVSRARARA